MINALVTLYNPNHIVVENVEVIAKQVDKLFLCDNSYKNNREIFESLKYYKNIYYIKNDRNLGLSLAFNKVLKNKDNNFRDEDYIIFFDQDSHIDELHINKLINEYEELIRRNINVGCLGPYFFNTSSNVIEVPKLKKLIYEETYSVKSVITSSMLTTFGNLKKINFWNENIFLDMADWDLCWRFIRCKLLCCMTKKVVMNHALGTGETHFLKIFRIKIGATIREYYQTRDCLYLLHEKYTPFKFKIRFFLMVTLRPLIHYLVLDDRKERIKYIIKGIKDYKRGIHGEFQEK